MEFLELVNAGLLLTVQCSSRSSASVWIGMGMEEFAGWKPRSSSSCHIHLRKLDENFPNRLFSIVKNFAPGQYFHGWGCWREKNTGTSPTTAFSVYIATIFGTDIAYVVCGLVMMLLTPPPPPQSPGPGWRHVPAEAGWRRIVSRDTASYSSSHAQSAQHSVKLVTNKTKVSWKS